MHFCRYLEMLQASEGSHPRPLIRGWSPDEIRLVRHLLRRAYRSSGLHGVPIREYGAILTNQAVGNHAATHIREALASSLPRRVKFCAAPGSGYPDNLLHIPRRDGDLTIALEVKATSHWDAKDSNRRVLTSSSRKLRQLFELPVPHLICTVIYHRGSGCIEDIRLDFIAPESEVSVRFEASTSHRLLDTGQHQRSLLFAA
ncbi:hypothetical protein ACEUZ9_004078 [Paracoccus litorisediminis]|uniref:hypothetical protein n=1 Tax=Paracoccus litorisediminis TaxID=2006130 RepID=UPI00372F7012